MADKRGTLIPGDQTAANMVTISRALSRGRTTGTKRRRKKTAMKKRATKRRAVRARKKTGKRVARPARMVKGSAAAKRHMAKLRRMRK